MAAAPHIARGETDLVADATQALYTRFGSQIYAYCLQQLRSREEAEDAVQTTFLNAFRGMQRGTVAHAEQAWLYKIAQNVCLARRSSSGRRRTIESPNDFQVLQEIIPSPAHGGELELIGLENALEQMPENQRRAILLREWQGLSYREIAEELDLSQAAVEMLIFRARRGLAKALERPVRPPKVQQRLGHGFELGSVFAALKSLLTGGAAVKAVAVAVAASTVTVVASEQSPSRVHQRSFSASRAAPSRSQAAAGSARVQAVVRQARPYALTAAPTALSRFAVLRPGSAARLAPQHAGDGHGTPDVTARSQPADVLAPPAPPAVPQVQPATPSTPVQQAPEPDASGPAPQQPKRPDSSQGDSKPGGSSDTGSKVGAGKPSGSGNGGAQEGDRQVTSSPPVTTATPAAAPTPSVGDHSGNSDNKGASNTSTGNSDNKRVNDTSKGDNNSGNSGNGSARASAPPPAQPTVQAPPAAKTDANRQGGGGNNDQGDH